MALGDTDVVVVIASDGEEIPVDSLAQTHTYSSGLLATTSIVWKNETYTKTYTWSGGNLTGESQWVKQ